MANAFQYLTFELKRGRESWTSFAAGVRSKAAKAIADKSGEIIGLFAPQLGFASNEAVVLVQGTPGAKSAFSFPQVVAVEEHALAPTVRPHDGQKLKAGGIYVHRWFTIDAERLADFIDLSNRAWSRFEGSYDTEIFGLFAASESVGDRSLNARRLLLLTWYRDHGVWEASREQSRDAASLFAQRHLLTRTTIGRSSVVVA